MQLIVDIMTNDHFGDDLIRARLWIPNGFRIITASLTSVECRSWMIRSSKFLNGRCVRDLEQATNDPIMEVLWLDLLLSLTTYSDGQSWLAKTADLVDLLVDKAMHNNSLPSLAILRNLSFHPGGRAKLLLLPNFLSLLSQSLRKDGAPLRLALATIWALAANCHKAKVALAKSGISRIIEEIQGQDSLVGQVYAVVSL